VPTETANAHPRPTAEPTAEPTPQPGLPQIDCSTARIPITDAIYKLFTERGYAGPEPLCSKTHGAWLNLADKKADIIFLVAPTAEELAYFAERNVDIEMKVYGYDGLVFMGNWENPVHNLTSQQIRDIYSGKIKNWNKLGGENSDIMVYIRNAESGSQRLFESLVWDGYKIPDWSKMGFSEDEVNAEVTQRTGKVVVDDDMSLITRNVLINQYAIGFNISSYIDTNFSDSGLKLFSVDGYYPNTANYASGNYPFLTTSYVAIRAGEPEGSPARLLYDWVGTGESDALIAQNSTLTVASSDSVFLYPSWHLYGNPGDNLALSALLTQLNQRFITRDDLLPFTPAEVAYLRNGIFALSGKIFKTKEYTDYFSKQAWYKKVNSSDKAITALFNEFQRQNLERILAYEKELQRAYANAGG